MIDFGLRANSGRILLGRSIARSLVFSFLAPARAIDPHFVVCQTADKRGGEGKRKVNRSTNRRKEKRCSIRVFILIRVYEGEKIIPPACRSRHMFVKELDVVRVVSIRTERKSDRHVSI